MPARARLAVSERGAPLEPQRTPIRIGVSREVHALALRVAAGLSLLAQEALEPAFVDIEAHQAVPHLINAELEVAVVDLAAFLGERVLGWDGLAIALFGPVATDRSCGAVIVEKATWTARRDACDRLVRAATRAISSLTDGSGELTMDQANAGVTGWWADCRPSVEELSEVVRWEPGPGSRILEQALAWRQRGAAPR